MRKFKGTKGPWNREILGFDIFNHGFAFDPVCRVHKRFDSGDITFDKRESEYNAQLIMMAPELLEAMSEFCHRVEKGEIRSKTTYTKFKKLILKATTI